MRKLLFDKYVNGELELTPILNILMNDQSCDWYALIGKYFLEEYGEENLKHQRLFDKIHNGSKKEKETSYYMLGTFFVCSYLDQRALKEMFGSPICHDKFGEGFQPRRTYTYCSYFIDINGHTVHIGFDERGTSIEVPVDLSSIEVFNIVKELVNIYCEDTF